jgi:RimJ/RimL family protein N-acetyltransferase
VSRRADWTREATGDDGRLGKRGIGKTMIEGERVLLRPIRADDLPVLRQWFDDAETMRFWGMPTPFVTEDQFDADLAGRFRRFDGAGYFVIELFDGTPIGRIDFERLDHQARSAEVMILIGAAEGRGKGYGTDAMVALLRYLFHQRNLHRVSLSVIAWNERAIRSYQRAGFVVEGRLRDHLYFDGRYHDQLVMSILRHEFDGKWSVAAESASTEAGN